MEESVGTGGIRSALRGQWRLALGSVLLISITTATVLWTLHHIRAEISTRLGSSLQAVLNTNRNAIHIWMQATKVDVSVLCQSEEVRAAVQACLQAGTADARSEFARRLRRLLVRAAHEYGFTDFAVVAPNGEQVAAARDDGLGRRDFLLGDPATVSAALSGQPAMGLPFLRKTGNPSATVPQMLAAAPVRDESGRIIAALVFGIDPMRDFTSITRLGRFSDTGESYVFNRKGLLLTSSRFVNRPEMSGNTGILTTELRDPAQVARGPAGLEHPLTRMAQSAIAGESGVDVQGYRDYRGVPVIGAWLWDRDLGIGIATEMDEAEAYAAWYTVRKLTLLMLLVIGAATLGMFGILVNHGVMAARAAAYQEAAGARQQALAVVSHELRNPLNTVALGAAALMKSLPASLDERQSETVKSNVMRIRRAAALMNQLIQDLLDAAKLQVGHLHLEPRQCDLRRLIEEVADLLGPPAAEKSIELQYDVDPSAPAIVADPTRITQVLSNLLVNAIKFTPAHGTVRVQLRRAPENVEFQVSDTGNGIPEQELPHIFDQYWQARRTEKMGTGLGLFIAKSIVELHGGRIAVESQPGRGTTFRFTIPVSSDHGRRTAAEAST